MLDNLKVRVRAMAKAWTETGDGLQYPVDADTSQHSGDFEEQDERLQDLQSMPDEQFNEIYSMVAAEYKRRTDGAAPIEWVRGELPGGVKIRTNKATGKWERV
jgi:hypothetical protein